MRMRNLSNNTNNKTNGLSPIMNGRNSTGCRTETGSMEWEMRPGGMLVQTRTTESDRNSVSVPTIRVKVKFGSIYHEVNISSQATFGNTFHIFSLQFCSFFNIF